MRHIASQQSSSTATNITVDAVSANAVDIRLDRVFHVSDSLFTIDEEQKQHRARKELEPDQDGYFNLSVGVYDILTSTEVNVADGEAGWPVIRSTFSRNGVYLTSGVYDAGYQGPIGAALHVTCGPVKIKHNTRIAQFLLFEAETLKLYDGDYGQNAGKVKAMEQTLYEK